MYTNTYNTYNAKQTSTENVAAGFMGALGGAAIGGAVIILLSRIGLVASVSGLILAVCTFLGYEKMAGAISKKGILISLALILVTPYLADRLDWAILIVQELGNLITLKDAFLQIPEWLELGYLDSDSYIKNLTMIYGFAALGAFSTIRSALKG